jgi:hypothetical protein
MHLRQAVYVALIIIFTLSMGAIYKDFVSKTALIAQQEGIIIQLEHNINQLTKQRDDAIHIADIRNGQILAMSIIETRNFEGKIAYLKHILKDLDNLHISLKQDGKQ